MPPKETRPTVVGQPTATAAASAPDLSLWLTKREAAQALAVAEKTIERMATRGELQQATRKQPGRAPIVVYHPDDVDRAMAAKAAPLPAHVMMPTGSDRERDRSRDTSDDGPTATTSPALLTHAGGPPAPALAALADLLAAALRGAAPLPVVATPQPTVPLNERMYLTLPEASALTGLSVAYLEQRIKDGTLHVLRDRSRKVRRADLAKL